MEEIKKQSIIIEEQRSLLDVLGGRVAVLESGSMGGKPAAMATAQPRSAEYLFARRSVRVWPINRNNDDALWKRVGEFIHTALRIQESDVSQYDIECIVPLDDPIVQVGNLNNEALIPMSKTDLEQSSRGKTAGILKRLAIKDSSAIIGPRTCFASPPAQVAAATLPGAKALGSSRGSSRARPRPWVPRASRPGA